MKTTPSDAPALHASGICMPKNGRPGYFAVVTAAIGPHALGAYGEGTDTIRARNAAVARFNALFGAPLSIRWDGPE